MKDTWILLFFIEYYIYTIQMDILKSMNIWQS